MCRIAWQNDKTHARMIGIMGGNYKNVASDNAKAVKLEDMFSHLSKEVVKPPHHNPNFKRRGPKKYGYTQDDLSKIFGLTKRQLRYAITSGKVDPTNLLDIIRFYYLILEIKREKLSVREAHSRRPL